MNDETEDEEEHDAGGQRDEHLNRALPEGHVRRLADAKADAAIARLVEKQSDVRLKLHADLVLSGVEIEQAKAVVRVDESGEVGERLNVRGGQRQFIDRAQDEPVGVEFVVDDLRRREPDENGARGDVVHVADAHVVGRHGADVLVGTDLLIVASALRGHDERCAADDEQAENGQVNVHGCRW